LAPGKLSHGLWDIFTQVMPGQVEGTNPVEIGTGETFHLWASRLEVTGKALEWAVSPVSGSLLLDDLLAEPPVEGDEFGIDGSSSPNLGGLQSLLDLGEEGVLAGRE
jgi:hypothetical protein